MNSYPVMQEAALNIQHVQEINLEIMMEIVNHAQFIKLYPLIEGLVE